MSGGELVQEGDSQSTSSISVVCNGVNAYQRPAPRGYRFTHGASATVSIIRHITERRSIKARAIRTTTIHYSTQRKLKAVNRASAALRTVFFAAAISVHG